MSRDNKMAEQTTMSRQTELEKELASIIRVRNRLALAPDEHLPKILKKLLPRLLNRLDKTILSIMHDDETMATFFYSRVSSIDPATVATILHLKQQIQYHLTGTLSHALERVKSNSNIMAAAAAAAAAATITTSVTTTTTTTTATSSSWIPDVSALLPTISTSMALTFTLQFLQVAIQQQQQRKLEKTDLQQLLAALIGCLDGLHGKTTTTMVETESVPESVKLNLRAASWLCLDAIGLLRGNIPPLVDWELDGFVVSDDKDVSQQQMMNTRKDGDDHDDQIGVSPGELEAVSTSNGTGIFHLILDLLLFWPREQLSRREFPVPRETVGYCTTGLSRDGICRMNHRRKEGSSWSTMTEGWLGRLKLACLNYAIWPPGRGLFQENGCGIGADRALLLAVLMESSSCAYGRLAKDYLKLFEASRSLQKEKCSFPMATSKCSFAVACSLLILVLGEEAAEPVLERHSKHKELWEGILGARAADPSFKRTPLPGPLASKSVVFIVDHLDLTGLQSSQGNTEGILFLTDLTLEIRNLYRDETYFAIQLIYKIYCQVQNLRSACDPEPEWIVGFFRRCIKTAASVLATVVEASESTAMPRPQHNNNEDLPLGVPEPFGMRADLNRLLSDHRRFQKKRFLCLEGAVKARKVCYRILTELAEYAEKWKDDSMLSFELPILLFQCIARDQTDLQKCGEEALTAFLATYKKVAIVEFAGLTFSALLHQVAPLLPPLLGAVCSDSTIAKITVVSWTQELLHRMDPDAAVFICNCLAKDDDSRVASIAQKVLTQLPQLETASSMQISTEFIDASNTQGIEMIYSVLDGRVKQTAGELSVSKDATEMLLHDWNFSVDQLLCSMKRDSENTLEASGLLRRCERMNCEPSHADLSGYVCGICYEEKDGGSDLFAVACGHTFCRDCWRLFLNTAFQEDFHRILALTCPYHECNERITGLDVSSLTPELHQKWRRCMFQSFLEKDSSYVQCPGPDCPMVAKLSSSMHSWSVLCTGCDTEFCPYCRGEPHQPAQCSDFIAWRQIFHSSTFWIAKNSKPCPGCNAPIEKNKGCNHMHCSQCNKHFCWLCLSTLNSHSEPHTCNRYDAVANAEDDDQRRALFFSDRYNAHHESEKYAKEQVDDADHKTDKLAEKFSWFFSEVEEGIFHKALATLVSARRFLKNSYVAVFGMREDNLYRDAFQTHQATLEVFTERLSQLTETNFERLFVEQGERIVEMHFRAISLHTASVENYMNRMLFLENPSLKDRAEFGR